MNATKTLAQSTENRAVASMMSKTPAASIGQLSGDRFDALRRRRSRPHTKNKQRKMPSASSAIISAFGSGSSNGVHTVEGTLCSEPS